MNSAVDEQETLVPKQSQKVRTDKPRPHQCNICLRGFVRVEHLKRHALVHTQERPYDCKQCGRKFGRRDLLIRHTRKLHPATQAIETNIDIADVQQKKKLKKSPLEEPLLTQGSKNTDPFSLHTNEFEVQNANNPASINHFTTKNIDDELKNQTNGTNPTELVLPIRPSLDKENTGSSGSITTRKRVRHSSFSAINSSTYNSTTAKLGKKTESDSNIVAKEHGNYYSGDANSYNLQPTISNGSSQEKGVSEVRFSTPPPIYDVLAHPERHELFQENPPHLEYGQSFGNANYDLGNAFSVGNNISNIIDYNQIITNLESIFPAKKLNLNNGEVENSDAKKQKSNEVDEQPEKRTTIPTEVSQKRRKSNLNFMNLNLNFNNMNIPFFNSKTPTPQILYQNKKQEDAHQKDHLKSVTEYQKYLGDQAMKNSPLPINFNSGSFNVGVAKPADYFNIKDDFYPESYFPGETTSNQFVKYKNPQEHINNGNSEPFASKLFKAPEQAQSKKIPQPFTVDHNDPWLNKFIESNFEDKIINDKNLNEFNLHFNDVGFDKNFIEGQKGQSHIAEKKTYKKKATDLPKINTDPPKSSLPLKPSFSSETDSLATATPINVKAMSPLQILNNIKTGDLKLSDLDNDCLAALYKVRQMDLWKDMLNYVNNDSPTSMDKKLSTPSTEGSGSIGDLAATFGKSKLASNSTPELKTILDKINTKHPQPNSIPRGLTLKSPTHSELLRMKHSIIKPVKLKWFDEELRQQIMSHHKLTQFPTCKELNQYVNLYKEEFCPYFDFIHLQSIKPSLENHALLSSIAAIGTLYSFHIYHATQLFVITRHTIRKILEDYTENKVHDIPLWVIQTMVNLSFVEMFHNSKEINSKVDIHFHTLIRIIQITELTKPLEKLQNPPIDGRNIKNDDNEKKKMFEYFITAQSRIRTCHIVLLVSNLFSALIGMDCRMHSVDLKEGGVPCSQVELFHCNDHLEWFSILSNKYKIIIDSKFSLVELSNGGDSYAHCLRYLCNAKANVGQYNLDAVNNDQYRLNEAGGNKAFDSFKKIEPDSLFELEDLHSGNLSMFTLMSMLLSIHEKIFIERSKNYSTYQWELKSKPIVSNLLDTWKSLFLKNDGVFYDIGTIAEINKTPKLRLILPLYYFARIRKSINISPILKHIWRKNIDGLNTLLDNLVESCLSANKTFFEGEDYNRNLLTEATLHCLDTIHLWGETVNYKIDTNKDNKHNISTPIFFITCISSSIIILSVFLQVLELTYKHGGALSDFEENVWIQSRRILQTLENRLNAIGENLKKLNIPGELIPPLSTISVQELQSWKEEANRETLKKHVLGDNLSLKCLYLGLRILLDAPIWPVCLSFGEVLNERGRYIHGKR